MSDIYGLFKRLDLFFGKAIVEVLQDRTEKKNTDCRYPFSRQERHESFWNLICESTLKSRF